MKNKNAKLLLLIVAVIVASTNAFAQTSAFTYQGKLADSGSPANGTYQFECKLFDAVTAGNQIGATQTVVAPVLNGGFTTRLDFGPAAFAAGQDRWLEVGVRLNGSVNPYTVLSPRPQVNSVPFAVRSLSATNADNATTAGNVTGVVQALNGGTGLSSFPVANTFLRSNGAGWTASGLLTTDIPGGSTNYIQNMAGVQSGNFNITGGASADVFNATTQYNIGGNRVFSIGGANNLFAGVNAGESNTGSRNAFFGRSSGRGNTSGTDNSFFGSLTGTSSNGNGNSFFGSLTGGSNTSGSFNSFFGQGSGIANDSGTDNSFLGTNSGSANATGSDDTLIGNEANVGSNNLSFATAIGSRALVTQSNSLVLGSVKGVNNATANVSVGIGTTAPSAVLDVVGAPPPAPLIGAGMEGENATPVLRIIGGNGGDTDPSASHTVGGAGADVLIQGGNGGIGSEGGSGGSITLQPGSGGIVGDLLLAPSSGFVGIGTAAPSARLDVNGIIRVTTLGAAGSTQLCRNASNQISACSSSLRYKINIKPFSNGLNFINLLRPIAFSWKDGGLKDVGFGAEDVARISPLLVTYNARGEVEGVKYDRLSVVFVNAFREQQTQISEQQRLIEKQQQQIDLLRQGLCSSNPDAAICKSN